VNALYAGQNVKAGPGDHNEGLDEILARDPTLRAKKVKSAGFDDYIAHSHPFTGRGGEKVDGRLTLHSGVT